MAEEKLFTFSLRKEFRKAPIYKKAAKAVTGLTELIARHMKVSVADVRIGRQLNLKMLSRGRTNPPSKIKIKVIMENKKAYAELPEANFETLKPKEDEKKAKKDSKPETKVEDKKKEDLKALEKEELKEMKKEHNPKSKGVPGKEMKENEKIKETTMKHERFIPQSGKKDSHEGKP